MDEIKEVTLEELGEIAGGARDDERHNLKNYVNGKVTGLPRGTYLYMRKTAGGAKMSVKFANGDRIQYHPKLTGGYYLAYSHQADKYGYVEAKYVK